jgi:hypothetical protein
MNRYEEKASKFASNYSKTGSLKILYGQRKDNKMELAKVFALNIQVGQLKEVLPIYEWTEEKFKEEREYFYWWLCQPTLGGRFKFNNQVEAWDMYKLVHETIEIEEDEEFTPSWLEEIENTINQAVRIANYSDYGGQQ